MASGGINDFYGLQSRFGNSVPWVKGIIEDYVFVDVAKVTNNTNNRLKCESSTRKYTNVEVMIIGVNGYGVKLVPAVGDRVILFAPFTPMSSIEEMNPTDTMGRYDVSGIKALPLTDSKTSQLLTVDRNGIKLTGKNKFTLNDNEITLQDANNNKANLDSKGIVVTDKNDNKVVTDSNGIAITDKNSNKITLDNNGIKITDKYNNTSELNSNGIKVTDTNKNTVTASSSGIAVKDSNNNEITMSSSGIKMKGNNKTVELSSSGVTLKGSSGTLQVK